MVSFAPWPLKLPGKEACLTVGKVQPRAKIKVSHAYKELIGDSSIVKPAVLLPYWLSYPKPLGQCKKAGAEEEE
jgi:hypothetical protein